MLRRTAAIVILMLMAGLVSGSGSVGAFSPVQLTQLTPEEGQTVIRVLLGKSVVLNSPEPLKRVSVTDPEVAGAIIITPHQVLIHGQRAGSVTLLLWDEEERTRSFELRVELDIRGLRDSMRAVFPEEEIQVSQLGGSVVLTGVVTAAEVGERAQALAETHGVTVANLMTTHDSSDVILLQVRFAEVNRVALQQLGANLISTGALNTPGVITTQQFSPPTATQLRGEIGAPIQGTTSEFNLTDLLNIFLFRPDLNLAVAVKALETRNLLQILAEPNVLALNGREASFLAGGEFPFPVVTGIGGQLTISIQFREFGVNLRFTPNILPDGKIRLKVAPEVSALDFANAVQLSGFLIPAISTRRAETEVDLADGQSFAIAGLIDNRVTEVANKIPGLGDIPFIGKLFRSRSLNQSNSELLVMVTPKLVKPIDPGMLPPDPDFPRPFLDPGKFDGRGGQTPRPSGGGR